MLASAPPRATRAAFFEDFFLFTAAQWTDTNDSGTGAVGLLAAAGAAGGWLSVATAAAANDYHLITAPIAIEFKADRPVITEIRFKVTESSANTAHWCVGLLDTVTTGFMADTTGEPPASWDGAVIYKPAGAAVIKAKSSNGSASVANTNLGTFVSGATYTAGITFHPKDGTTGEVQFFLNEMGSSSSFVVFPPHKILLASMAPMALAFGIKASASAAETILVDYVGCEITR